MRLREAMKPGETMPIGSYEFTPDRIIEFAREFDPHFFHIDAEEAKNSLFGGLCASGWHVCSAAMKCYVSAMSDMSDRITAEGAEAPKLGPSPGVKNLKWFKPVYAGDTVSYSLRFNKDTAIPHRPGRHLCDITWEGVNQNGEMVTQFDCSVVEFE